MKTFTNVTIPRLIVLLLTSVLALMQGTALGQDRILFSQQQLDQMLAPVALYPDPLLAHMLMASTYPIEVIEAARWSRAHRGLQGDQAVDSAAQQDWDPSVKSLLLFPQVLAWMDENLEWTRALGDAFLAQEPQIMETVQALRQRAQATGSLHSGDRVRVLEEAQSIALEPADPQLIYVPYYDPRVVYGPWWWPGSPPLYLGPWPGYYLSPGYVASVYWPSAIGISAKFFFGSFDWRRRQIRVVHGNSYHYNTVGINHQANTIAGQTSNAGTNRTPGVWQHDPAHRRSIAYRDPALQNQFSVSRAQQAKSPSAAPARGTSTSSTVSPESRNGSIHAPDSRLLNARSGANESTDARDNRSEYLRHRPEMRPAQPETPRAEVRNEARIEAPRAITPRPEMRPVQPEARRAEVRIEPRIEAPRAITPRPEMRPAQPEARRVEVRVEPRIETPRAITARPEMRRPQPETRRDARS